MSTVHIELYLDEKLNYNTSIKERDSALRNLLNKLSRQIVVKICKFVKLHFEYGDIVYEKRNNKAFSNKTEKA